MTPRCAVLSLALLIFGLNTYAGANNPDGAPQSESVTVNQKSPGTKAEERKLSRKERKERLRVLPDRYHEFLTKVEPIITPEEVNALLLLDTDAQRDYFIERFWMIRDTDPRTPRNEFRERYEELLVEAEEMFSYLSSDRARVYLTYGRPDDIVEIDCTRLVVPMQIWSYGFVEGLGHDVLLIFFQPRLGRDYRLWQPVWGMREESMKELLSIDGEQRGILDVFYGQGGTGMGRGVRWECRNGELLLLAIGWGQRSRLELQKIFMPPEIDPEHVGRTMRNTVVVESRGSTASRYAGSYLPGAPREPHGNPAVGHGSNCRPDSEGAGWYELLQHRRDWRDAQGRCLLRQLSLPVQLPG